MSWLQRFWLCMACGVAALSAHAQTGPEAAPLAQDPVVEARLVGLSQELRCLVCQNESLASSHAELADDLRREVRDLIRQGKTDQEVKDFLVARYGDVILMKPPVQPDTWLLWLAPFLVLGAGGAVAWVVVKKAAARSA